MKTFEDVSVMFLYNNSRNVLYAVLIQSGPIKSKQVFVTTASNIDLLSKIFDQWLKQI